MRPCYCFLRFSKFHDSISRKRLTCAASSQSQPRRRSKNAHGHLAYLSCIKLGDIQIPQAFDQNPNLVPRESNWFSLQGRGKLALGCLLTLISADSIVPGLGLGTTVSKYMSVPLRDHIRRTDSTVRTPRFFPSNCKYLCLFPHILQPPPLTPQPLTQRTNIKPPSPA